MKVKKEACTGSTEKIAALFRTTWESAVSRFRSDPLKWGMTCCLFAVIGLMMSGIVIGDRGKNIVDTLMLISAAAFGGLLVWKKRLAADRSSLLLLAYALWLTVLRLCHGGLFEFQTVERVGMALFGAIVCFGVPLLFKTDDAKRKLRLAAANLVVCFGTICALLTLLIVVFGVNIRIGSVLDFSDWIHIVDAGSFKGRLYFSAQANLVAQIICLGICAAVLCAMETKVLWKKAAYVVTILLMLIVLTMSDSRSVTLIVSLVMGFAAGIALFAFINDRAGEKPMHRAVQIAACVLCGAAVVAGSFVYIDGQKSVIENIAGGIRTAAVTQEQQSVSEDGMQQDEELVLADRGYDNAGEMLSMNGRDKIYAKAWQTLMDSPEIFLFGELFNEDIIPLENRNSDGEVVTHWQAVHWHNSFIEVLFETGIVGLGLTVAFVVLLLVRMIKVFFGAFSEHTAADKFALAIPASVLILGMLEPVVFSVYEQYIPKLVFTLFLVWSGLIMSAGEKACRRAGE